MNEWMKELHVCSSPLLWCIHLFPSPLSLSTSSFFTQPSISRRVLPIRAWSYSRFLPVKGRFSLPLLVRGWGQSWLWSYMIKVELKIKINIFSVTFHLRSGSQRMTGWLTATIGKVWLRWQTAWLTLISSQWWLYLQLRRCEESRSENSVSRELRQRLIVKKTPECFPIPALGQPIGAQHLPNQHLEVIMSTLPSANAVTEAGRDWLIITPWIMDAGLRRAAGGAGPLGRDN